MPTDIYTGKCITQDSEEHILPRSLGGRLTMNARLDRATNSRFGHTIDAALDDALRAVRILLDARSTDGEPARPLTSVPGADGKTYSVESGGIVIPEPQVATARTADGKLQIRAVLARSGMETRLRGMLAKFARRAGVPIDEFVKPFLADITHHSAPPPPLTFAYELGNQGPYRATAKIACNLLAHRQPDVVLGPDFDAIRSYILEGVGASEAPVQAVDIDIIDNSIGAFDHLVKVQIGESGEVLGLIVYFRLLAFVVRLARLPTGTIAPRSYRVDQLGGSHRIDDERDLDMGIPSYAAAAARSYEEYAELVQHQLERLLPMLQAYQHNLWLERLIRSQAQLLRERFGDWEDPTSADLKEFAGALAQAVVEGMMPQMEAAAARRRAEALASMGGADK